MPGERERRTWSDSTKLVPFSYCQATILCRETTWPITLGINIARSRNTSTGRWSAGRLSSICLFKWKSPRWWWRGGGSGSGDQIGGRGFNRKFELRGASLKIGRIVETLLQTKRNFLFLFFYFFLVKHIRNKPTIIIFFCCCHSGRFFLCLWYLIRMNH